MSLLVLLGIGVGGYLLLTQLTGDVRSTAPPALVSSAAKGVWEAQETVYEMWKNKKISAEDLERGVDTVATTQRQLRESNLMTMAEYNILNARRVAILEEAGML